MHLLPASAQTSRACRVQDVETVCSLLLLAVPEIALTTFLSYLANMLLTGRWEQARTLTENVRVVQVRKEAHRNVGHSFLGGRNIRFPLHVIVPFSSSGRIATERSARVNRH